tara:strand:+ start:4078 stop:4563 length:486 start_codon:yes stop_codon:yes gene_type:complete
MIRRRKALKNIGLLTGGILSLPYSCNFVIEISYSNLPLIKAEQQQLIAAICNFLLPLKVENFPTPEPREHFVLNMVNCCLDSKERFKFLNGFEAFQNLIIDDHETIIASYLNKEKSDIGLFLNYLKDYSVLHFETSENYMKNYLNFEFMPGRYNGSVQIEE